MSENLLSPEAFARNAYETYILIDFAACSDEVHHLFNDVSNLDFIFLRLQMIYATELRPRCSARSPNRSLPPLPRPQAGACPPFSAFRPPFPAFRLPK